MGFKKEIGIIINKNYPPSYIAGKKIEDSLKSIRYKAKIFGLDDLIKNKVTTKYNFNVFYGEIGDGGMINNLLKKNKKICIGNNEKTCAFMLNKVITKKILEKNNILTPKYWYQCNNKFDWKEIFSGTKKLGLPLMAKYVNGSASEGVLFLKDEKSLSDFIKKNISSINNGLFFFEKYIKGVELSCGCINGIKIKLPVVEIRLKKDDFQSQEVKFGQDKKENIIPANIPKDIYKLSQSISKKVHDIFECDAFSRTDMIFSENKIYVLETNTNPGLLPTSLLPLLVKQTGINYDDMIKKIINTKYRI